MIRNTTVTCLFMICAGCGAATPQPEREAPVPTGHDLSSPEGLVRAVFAIIQSEDTEAFVGLYPSSAADFEALGAIRQPPPPPPTEEQLANMRARVAERFGEFLGELRARGIEPAEASLVEVRTDRAMVRGDQGFAEDLTAVISSGEVTVPVTIDDCILLPRGWGILDGLRIRE